MKISDYLAHGYTIMDDAIANSYSFFSATKKSLTERILLHKYGMRELFYTDTDPIIQDIIKVRVKDLFDDNLNKWEKQFSTINLSYDPLKNIQMSFLENEENSGEDSAESSQANSGQDIITNINSPGSIVTSSKRTYDNATFADAEKTASSGQDTNTGTTQHGHNISINNTQNYGKKVERERTEQGYSGIDIQETINKERAIADFNFISIIAEAIANNISILSYNFEEYDLCDYGESSSSGLDITILDDRYAFKNHTHIEFEEFDSRLDSNELSISVLESSVSNIDDRVTEIEENGFDVSELATKEEVEDLKKVIHFPIKNLLIDGLANWSGIQYITSTILSNGILDIYESGTQTPSRAGSAANISIISGHIYMAYINAACSNTENTVITLYKSDNTDAVASPLNVSIGQTRQDYFFFLTPNVTVNDAKLAYLGYTSVRNHLYIYDAMLIDLTDTFGAGNEYSISANVFLMMIKILPFLMNGQIEVFE